MAVYLTNTAELTSIADAIREKGGTEADLEYPTEFVSAIQALETGEDGDLLGYGVTTNNIVGALVVGSGILQ